MLQKARIYILYSLLVPFLLFNLASEVNAEVVILNEEYKSLGIKISKSSIVQLADLKNNSGNMMGRVHYLPAGTILHLSNRTHVRDGRERALAVTENGLLIYVLTTPGSQFYDSAPLMKLGGGKIALSHRKFPVQSKEYGEVWITPSEFYQFEFSDDDKINIIIDKNKMNDKFTKQDTVVVDQANFSIVTQAEIDAMQQPDHFVEYDVSEKLKEVITGIADLDISDDDKKNIKDFLDNRFVSRKDCNKEISLSHDIQGSAGLKIDSLLSPLEAALAVSGKLASTTQYGKGTRFEIQRYSKGDAIYEIKNEMIRKKCEDLDLNGRVVVSDEQGRIAEINSLTANELGLKLTANGLPKYSCRDQYLDLLQILIDDYELSDSAAVLGIVRGARYSGNKDASVCSPSS